MESPLKLVHSAVTRSAAYMVDYANQYHCKVTFAVDSYAWLSTDHLELPMNLLWKLASHYICYFKVIDRINPFAFIVLLPYG